MPVTVPPFAGHGWVPSGPLPRFEHRERDDTSGHVHLAEMDVGLLDGRHHAGIGQPEAERAGVSIEVEIERGSVTRSPDSTS
jgi:hypothetical protein